MTPEKLEAWAKLIQEEAGKSAWRLEMQPEVLALSFRGQDLSPVAFAGWLLRLAAKMREPDGFHCIFGEGPDTATEEWVFTEPVDEADSCRPILYLDSLEEDDG